MMSMSRGEHCNTEHCVPNSDLNSKPSANEQCLNGQCLNDHGVICFESLLSVDVEACLAPGP